MKLTQREQVEYCRRDLFKITASEVYPCHFSTFAFDYRSRSPSVRFRSVAPSVTPRQIIARVFWNIFYCARRVLIKKILIDRYEIGIDFAAQGFSGSNKLLAGDEGKDGKKSKFDLHRFCSRKEATRRHE